MIVYEFVIIFVDCVFDGFEIGIGVIGIVGLFLDIVEECWCSVGWVWFDWFCDVYLVVVIGVVGGGCCFLFCFGW